MTAPAPQAIRVAHLTTIDITLQHLLLPQLQAIQREGYAVAGISAPGPWVPDLQRAGVTHYSILSLTRGRNLFADLRAIVELVRLFRRERFTIVHTHMPKTGVLGRVAARLAGISIIVNTVHGPYGIDAEHPLRRWFFLSLERLAARCSHYELSQSKEIYDLFTRLAIFDRDRSAYLGNGVDLQHFNPERVSTEARARLRQELSLKPGDLVVGTVGRLAIDKGYAEFIAAAEHVRAVCSNVTFVAVGPREERDALPPDLMRRGEAAGVRFLGFRTDMRELYALMDVFVLASYREGFPRSAIEAAAMGKPMVLTDIRGCREVAKHGYNGLLVPKQQVRPLADAVQRLIEDSELRARFGARSRNLAVAEFDHHRVHQRVLGVYRTLLRSRGSTEYGIHSESPA